MGSIADAVFERECRAAAGPVERRVARLARVCEPRSSGADPAASGRRADGMQRVLIAVAAADGGFVTSAATLGAGGPALRSGDLVLWTPTQDEAWLGGIDLRPLIKGYVVACVVPGSPAEPIAIAHAWG